MIRAAVGHEYNREGRRLSPKEIRQRGLVAVGKRLLRKMDEARAAGRALPSFSGLESEAVMAAHEEERRARG